MAYYLSETQSRQDPTDSPNMCDSLVFDFEMPRQGPACHEESRLPDDPFTAGLQAVLDDPPPPKLPPVGSIIDRITTDDATKRACDDHLPLDCLTRSSKRSRVSEIYDQLDEILSPMSTATSDTAVPPLDDKFKLDAHQLAAPSQLFDKEPFAARNSSLSNAPESSLVASDIDPTPPDANLLKREDHSLPMTPVVSHGRNRPLRHDNRSPISRNEEKGTPEPSFECNFCRKSFTRHCNMIKHKRTAHGIMKDFPCKDCWVSFPRKDLLEEHMEQIHKRKGSFSCQFCGATFSQKFNLNKHIRNVHEKKRPFGCKQCGQSFQQRDHLNKHVQTVHEKQRPYKCPMCDMAFGWHGVLNKHIQLVHQKERPFACELCPSAFQQKAHLEKHYRTHDQGQPFATPEIQTATPVDFLSKTIAPDPRAMSALDGPPKRSMLSASALITPANLIPSEEDKLGDEVSPFPSAVVGSPESLVSAINKDL